MLRTLIWNCGEACIVLATSFFALKSVLVRLTGPALPVLETCTFYPALCATLILATSLAGGNLNSLIPRDSRTAGLVGLKAICGTATLLCITAAVQLAGVHNATALFFTSPTFALLMESLFNGRLPGRGSLLGALITIIGALLVFGSLYSHLLGHVWTLGGLFNQQGLPGQAGGGGGSFIGLRDTFEGSGRGDGSFVDHVSVAADWSGAVLEAGFTKQPVAAWWAGYQADASTLELVGLGLAVSAAMANSLSMVAVAYLGGAMSAMGLTLWDFLATAVVAASSQILLLLLSWTTAAWPVPLPPAFVVPGRDDWLLLVGIVGAQLLALILMNRGYSVTTATRGSFVSVTEVVFAFTLDFFVLGNVPTASSVLGGSLVVIGVLVLAAARGRDQFEQEACSGAREEEEALVTHTPPASHSWSSFVSARSFASSAGGNGSLSRLSTQWFDPALVESPLSSDQGSEVPDL